MEVKEVALEENNRKGGPKAWLCVLASFFLFINAWGLTQTFGAFNQHYVSSLLSGSSASAISWVGSVQVFLLILAGVFTGPLFDAGYLRPLLVMGCFLVVLGMSLLSLTSVYWQVFLAQGVCVGLGSGLLYVPTLALVSTLFSDAARRAWAIGCVNGGGSVGGIIYTFMLRELVPAIGFNWAVRAIALVILVLSVVALAILMPGYRLQAHKHRRAWFDLRALCEPSFLLFSFALLLNYLAFYIPPFYIAMYATVVLGQSRGFAFECLVFLSIGSLIGRTVPMLAAARFGSLQVYITATVGTVVILFAWTAVHNAAGFVAFCVIYGIVSGVQIAAPSAAMSHPVLSPTMEVIGTRMGMCWMFAGVGALVGSPVAGALVSLTPGRVDFRPAQGFAGAAAAGAVVCSIVPLVAVIRYNKDQE